MTSKSALVLVSIKVISGLDSFRKLVEEFKTISWELDFSSVYRQFEDEKRYDFDANMITVAKITFSLTTEDFVARLQQLQNYLTSFVGADRIKITPLVVEQEYMMTPELTLPHPSLHTEALITRCAAEVWGTYEHPVLKRSLNDMARNAPVISDAEFMLQGKSLVTR